LIKVPKEPLAINIRETKENGDVSDWSLLPHVAYGILSSILDIYIFGLEHDQITGSVTYFIDLRNDRLAVLRAEWRATAPERN
jgi:hypothetical protein